MSIIQIKYKINHLIPKFTVITACSIDDLMSDWSKSYNYFIMSLLSEGLMLSAENNLLIYFVY